MGSCSTAVGAATAGLDATFHRRAAGATAVALAAQLAEGAPGLAALDGAERLLLREVAGGVRRAQALYAKRSDEVRRLRMQLRQAQAQQASEKARSVTTSGSLQFGDRVVFVRRSGLAGSDGGGAAAAGGGGGGGGTPAGRAPPLTPIVLGGAAPSYVAVREEGRGHGKPHFLAKASESGLLGQRRGAASSLLPAMAFGTVVHVEHLTAPLDAGGEAAALGLRPGADYAIITAEMSTGTLAPEVEAAFSL
jgi:hypothetical protein